MRRKKVLVPRPMLHPIGEEILRQEVEVERGPSPALPDLLKAVEDAHGLVVVLPVRVPADLIRAGRLLEVISTHGAGFEHIDVEAATAAGIPVVNNVGVGPIPVAEHALGMMICLAKRIVWADRALRPQGNWGVREDLLAVDRQMGHELEGKTVGIVGLGNIGTLLAHKCRLAFHMRVLAYDPFVSRERMEAMGVTKVEDLMELLREADFVSLHLPSMKETRGIIGREQLRAMKRTAYLINCARGAVVDEAALVQALREGWIAGAGLDVFEPEPPSADNPLFKLDNVVLTPHIAGVTEETARQLAISVATQVLQVLRGERPPHLVNPEVWPRFLERRAGLSS